MESASTRSLEAAASDWLPAMKDFRPWPDTWKSPLMAAGPNNSASSTWGGSGKANLSLSQDPSKFWSAARPVLRMEIRDPAQGALLASPPHPVKAGAMGVFGGLAPNGKPSKSWGELPPDAL